MAEADTIQRLNPAVEGRYRQVGSTVVRDRHFGAAEVRGLGETR